MHKKYVRFKRGLNRRKRAAQNSAERRVDREGEGQAEIQNELLPLSKKHSQGKQSACFSAEEVRRLQGGWGAQRKAAKFRKKGRAADCSSIAATEERGQRALNAALPLLDATKNFRPSAAGSFCTAPLQKLKKGKGSTFVFALGSRHCCWLSMMLFKLGSAFPKDPSEQKSGS